MKKNKGSALVITAVLMLVVSLLSVMTFSIFMTKYNLVRKKYQLLKETIEVEVIAQDIYLQLNKLVLDGTELTIYVDEEAYLVSYDNENNIYKYSVEKEFKKQKVFMVVNIKPNYEITIWKVWSE